METSIDTDKKLVSKAISFLRLPLMLIVVISHVNIGYHTMPLYETIYDILSVQIVQSAVCLFFFISGYLFFYNIQNTFTIRDYKKKLIKRVHSLLIPYLFWNAFVIVCFAILHSFFAAFIDENFNNIYNFTLIELVRSFWDYPGGQPICYQFWFLKELMIGVLFTPLFYIIAKYGKRIAILFWIGVLLFPCAFPYKSMITCFGLGTCFSINRYDVIKTVEKCGIYAIIAFGSIIFCNEIHCLPVGVSEYFDSGTKILIGMLSFLYLSILFVKRDIKISPKYADSSFFLYAAHGFFVVLICKAIILLLHPSSEIMCITTYLLCYVITVIFCYSIYWFLKRFFPRFSTIINGNR